jgi:hypothetical protein
MVRSLLPTIALLSLVAAAEARADDAVLQLTMTTGGEPVGRYSGWFGVYRVGERGTESYLAYAPAGGSVTVPAGTYDVGVNFSEGAAAEHRWLENLRFEGDVDRRVEVGLVLARVTVVVTNGGIPVGPHKAWWGLYAPGDREHANYVAYAASGAPLTLPAGTYDLGVHFADGPARLVKWIPGVLFEGSVERTVEVGVPLADVVVFVTRRGKPLLSASCGVFPEGEERDPTAWATSARWMRVAEGTADVGCFFSEGGLSTAGWVKGVTLRGKVELSMALDVRPASLTVTAPRESVRRATPTSAATQPNLEIILDASGSMVAKVGAKTRMTVAKEVLRSVIKSLPASGVNVALRVYGTAAKSAKDCKDSKLLVPLGAIDKQALSTAIESVHASGYTPIAHSLEQAAADLPAGGANSLVLITDGLESCGGDPCAMAARLAAQGYTARSFVVGFGLHASHAKHLQCIGKYYPASSQAQLKKALGSILQASLKAVLGTVTVYPAGVRTSVVAKGALGDRLGFVAGTYDVVIESEGKQVVWSGLAIDTDLVVPLGEKPE